LQKKCSVSRPTLASALKKLKERGLLTWEGRAGIGQGKQSSLYTITPISKEGELIDEKPRKVKQVNLSEKEQRKVKEVNSKSKAPEQEPSLKHHLKSKERENTAETLPKPTEKKRASRLSLDSLPEEWEVWARNERPDIDPVKTWAIFSDYWKAQPDSKGRKLDWLATWRNWIRRENGGNGYAGNRQLREQRRATINAAIDADIDAIVREMDGGSFC
jgi:hypothetical protein